MTQQEIEAKYEKQFPGPRGIETNQGWNAVLTSFMEELLALPGGDTVRFFCIKEKFGFMTIQANTIGKINGDAWDALVKKYEKLSSVTCKVCGDPAMITNDKGWLAPLCEVHKPKETTF